MDGRDDRHDRGGRTARRDPDPDLRGRRASAAARPGGCGRRRSRASTPGDDPRTPVGRGGMRPRELGPDPDCPARRPLPADRVRGAVDRRGDHPPAHRRRPRPRTSARRRAGSLARCRALRGECRAAGRPAIAGGGPARPGWPARLGRAGGRRRPGGPDGPDPWRPPPGWPRGRTVAPPARVEVTPGEAPARGISSDAGSGLGGHRDAGAGRRGSARCRPRELVRRGIDGRRTQPPALAGSRA